MSKAQTLGRIKSPNICFSRDGNLSPARHLEVVPYMAARSPASLPCQMWVTGWDLSHRGRSMNTACHYIKRWSQVPCIWGNCRHWHSQRARDRPLPGKNTLVSTVSHLLGDLLPLMCAMAWQRTQLPSHSPNTPSVQFSAQGLEAACVPHPCFHKRLRRGFLTVYRRARTTQHSQSK